MVGSKIRWWAAVPVAATLLAGVAAVAASLPFDFIRFGNFTRMVESGQSGGQVLLADLPQRKGDWGLGATAGLKGEIVQIDGRLLVSPGSDAQGRVQAPQRGEEAVLFAGARVAAWADVTVPSDMSQTQLESFVRERAAAHGLSLEQPFVFRVEGRFPHLMWHVMTGEPPAGGQGQPGQHGGHRGHGAMMAGGHVNQRSDMKVFHAPGAPGRWWGSTAASAWRAWCRMPASAFTCTTSIRARRSRVTSTATPWPRARS